MAVNVPISGPLGKHAPTAKSGSNQGPDTGPPPDLKGGAGESMYDAMPPTHYSKPNLAELRKAAADASEAQDGGM